MKKLAIFVEGQTEQIFVENLLREIVGKDHISMFLSEWNHFTRIDARLTPHKIQTDLGFNPETDNMETRLHPSSDMDQIYRLVDQNYEKKKTQIELIVSNLDYEFLYLKLVHTVPSLGEFINYIHLFLN